MSTANRPPEVSRRSSLEIPPGESLETSSTRSGERSTTSRTAPPAGSTPRSPAQRQEKRTTTRPTTAPAASSAPSPTHPQRRKTTSKATTTANFSATSTAQSSKRGARYGTGGTHTKPTSPRSRPCKSTGTTLTQTRSGARSSKTAPCERGKSNSMTTTSTPFLRETPSLHQRRRTMRTWGNSTGPACRRKTQGSARRPPA
ncbi:hypothetical protein BKA80DRAFT_284311 [Phyllosticta citrichinensis]